MLNDVNTTDIPAAIRLGCETMQRIFNPDDQNRPYFDARVRPIEQIGFAFMCPFSDAHIPGRHLHALLNAHELLNIPLDETAINNHRDAAFHSFSGPVPFPLNRDRIGGTLLDFLDHNLREGLFALNALVRFRGDDEARRLADRCIEAVFDYWDPITGWDKARLNALGLRFREQTFIYGPARAIGPLLAYHQTTGSPRAIQLARILAQKAIDSFFLEDGQFDLQTFGPHCHSTTCTLSSLTQLALFDRDARMLQRVRAFFGRGLWQMRNEIGWVIENAGPDTLNPDRGEVNNTGDILETALMLGSQGDDRYFHDAERILRCHLLPAQLRDTAFVPEPTDPLRPDAARNVAGRMRGAFGFPAPYGHHPLGMTIVDFCLDIVGGAVSSLCEAWRAAVTSDHTGHHVNMLFDRNEGNVRVESPYTHAPHKHLRITLHEPGPLWIRIPPWVDRTQTKVTGATAIRWQGGRLVIENQPLGRPVTVEFELPIEQLTLQHATRTIRVRLRGDEVSAMENHGASLTYFPPLA